MTIKECYEQIGENFDTVAARFGGRADMVERFAKMFLASDHSYQDLFAALEAGDAEKTFRAAHTLKGVSANVGFGRLQDASDKLTEALRAQDLSAVDPVLYDKVKEEYDRIVAAMANLG